MKDRRGFTLLELVITTAVGAIVITALSLSIQAQLKSSMDNRNYLVALNLAKRQMAVVMNAAYPAVQAETAQTADPNFPNFIPTLQVVSADTSGGLSLREVYVRIRYGSSSGPVLAMLFTYRSDLVRFGNGS